ncbi:MAG: hypothetical protein LBU27_09910 [Candidatus Peribacteria bacterium]|jgi:hypothetical protein|nr:hypothetical protein [Candidatus Peribacteria bacterium]
MFTDNEENERFWNFMIFKVYATNKEMEEIEQEIGPGCIIAGIIVLVVVGIALLIACLVA